LSRITPDKIISPEAKKIEIVFRRLRVDILRWNRDIIKIVIAIADGYLKVTARIRGSKKKYLWRNTLESEYFSTNPRLSIEKLSKKASRKFCWENTAPKEPKSKIPKNSLFENWYLEISVARPNQ
jgi:hypothetical protein